MISDVSCRIPWKSYDFHACYSFPISKGRLGIGDIRAARRFQMFFFLFLFLGVRGGGSKNHFKIWVYGLYKKMPILMIRLLGQISWCLNHKWPKFDLYIACGLRISKIHCGIAQLAPLQQCPWVGLMGSRGLVIKNSVLINFSPHRFTFPQNPWKPLKRLDNL